MDGDGRGDTGDPSFWTKEATANEVAVVDGVVGIGTGTYGNVRVVVEIHDSEPELKLDAWDHVTVAGLEIRSGVLRVEGCLDSKAMDFHVSPGHYHVRCCHANLIESDPTGSKDSKDWYLVQVWLGPPIAPTVLKRWLPKLEDFPKE
jgi:hypothetical protein